MKATGTQTDLSRTAALAGAYRLLACAAALWTAAGCVPQPAAPADDVAIRLINVTDFAARVLVSGVAGGLADVQEEFVEPLDSTSVTFSCLDELVVGNPFDFTVAGARIVLDGGQAVELDPFILSGDDFACGDTIEVILSGDRPENLALNVFVLSPPAP